MFQLLFTQKPDFKKNKTNMPTQVIISLFAENAVLKCYEAGRV